MLFTETEARGKYCCVAMQHKKQMTQNIFSPPPKCEASGCMAWRWGEKATPEIKFPATPEECEQEKEPRRPDDLPESWIWKDDYWSCEGTKNHWEEPQAEADAKRRRGYCGMCSAPRYAE